MGLVGIPDGMLDQRVGTVTGVTGMGTAGEVPVGTAGTSGAGRPRRIGILGGTFNPMHLGHLAVARAAVGQLGLDELWVMPAGRPNFKRGMDIAGPRDRVRMCELTIAGEPAMRVDTREVERDGITYTSDTLREVVVEVGGGAVVFFITGTDAFLTLPHWHEAEVACQLATFAVVGRPGSAGARDAIRAVEASGIAVRAVGLEVGTPDVSSTAVRAAAAAGEDLGGMVAPGVEEYIRSQGLYGSGEMMEIGGVEASGFKWAGGKAAFDADQAEELAYLEERVRAQLGGRRLEHVLRVAETCERMAERYGVDPYLAKCAGYLHDWHKKVDADEQWRLACQLGFVEPGDDRGVEPLLHGWISERLLPAEFPELPECVWRAVGRHTLGAVDMSPLDMVVYLADMLEPGRKGPQMDELRGMAGRLDLAALFAVCNARSIIYVLQKGRYLHPAAVEVYNAYQGLIPKE